jgi:hypothetical protein
MPTTTTTTTTTLQSCWVVFVQHLQHQCKYSYFVCVCVCVIYHSCFVCPQSDRNLRTRMPALGRNSDLFRYLTSYSSEDEEENDLMLTLAAAYVDKRRDLPAVPAEEGELHAFTAALTAENAVNVASTALLMFLHVRSAEWKTSSAALDDEIADLTAENAGLTYEYDYLIADRECSAERERCSAALIAVLAAKENITANAALTAANAANAALTAANAALTAENAALTAEHVALMDYLKCINMF